MIAKAMFYNSMAMRMLITILLIPWFSGCMNMLNHVSVGNEGVRFMVFSLFRGPAYDDLIYCGTRDVGGGMWDCCGRGKDLGVIPFLIMDIPFEIAMDTITFPYDIYAYFQADELAAQARLRKAEALLRRCRERAEQGDADAQYGLGCHYFYNDGGVVEKDEVEAVKWLRRAAEQGHLKAAFLLGWILRSKEWMMAKDEVEAINRIRKAAEQGDAEAQLLLGLVCACPDLQAGRYVSGEAMKWFRAAAEQGEARACYYLGLCYYDGWLVAENVAEAVEWFRKAAEQGVAKAQLYLGLCYYNGMGVAKDVVEAVKWYRKAAEQGDAKAQFVLGRCYYNGMGVAKDEVEAVKWYRKAAEQGDADAQMILNSLKP